MRKRHTAAFKAQLVRELLREEKSINQLAAEHGLHPNQLYRWRDQALEGLPSLFADTSAQQVAAQQHAHEAEVQKLYAEIGRLTTELGWLKKKVGHLVD